MTPDDTIAALCSAPGEAGIAVIRISGPAAFAIADRVVRCGGRRPSERPSHTIVYGTVGDGARDLDEVLVLLMRAPRSFTREDVVELHCHGGRMPARRILRRLGAEGARPAEPGEFTRRAFLNGRIDLLQAEAVMDLIGAQSDRAAAAAMEQLEGGLSRRFDALYDSLLAVAGELEASLDFPEEELPEPILPAVAAALDDTAERLEDLLGTWDEGHLLREGATVVISGRPNAGKSSLLNALLGAERAIVSSTPGTTRDAIEEGWVIDGVPLRLVDTAGLRATTCEIEREGIRRTRRHVERADLHLLIIDRSESLDAAEAARLGELDPAGTVIVLNKADLPARTGSGAFPGFRVVETCLLRNEGVDRVRAAVVERLETALHLERPPHAVISERHRVLLLRARAGLDEARGILAEGGEADLVVAASRLRDALDELGAATGRMYHDELLDAIFTRFCIGK